MRRKCEIDIAEYGGEQIVEIVCDTAGQAADRFHLLRLPQSAFGQFAPRHFLQQSRMRHLCAPVRRNATRLTPNNAIVAGIPNIRWPVIVSQPIAQHDVAFDAHTT